jgi:hypothetical protein
MPTLLFLLVAVAIVVPLFVKKVNQGEVGLVEFL